MKKRLTPTTFWLPVTALCLASLSILSGCSKKGNDITVNTGAIGNSVEKGAKEVGQAASNAAKKAVPVIEDSAETLKVKGAIMADNRIDWSKINVDVKNNEVILRGRVQNGAQKTLAAEIAKKNAPGYHLVNQLEITSQASSIMKKPAAPAKKP